MKYQLLKKIKAKEINIDKIVQDNTKVKKIEILENQETDIEYTKYNIRKIAHLQKEKYKYYKKV